MKNKRSVKRNATVAVVAASLVCLSVMMVWPYLSDKNKGRQTITRQTAVAVGNSSRWQREELVKMSASIPIADVSETTVMPPAAEISRIAGERSASNVDVGVQISASLEGAAPIHIEKVNYSRFRVQLLAKGEQNWFVFRVTDVPKGGQVLRIDFDSVDVGSWKTLNPVFTYGEDLSQLSLFSDEGVPEATERAFNGALLPAKSETWTYIKDVWTEGASRLSVVQEFKRDAIVAMRFPYTPSYNERFIESIAGVHGVSVFDLGRSDAGRRLQIIKVSDGEQSEMERPCILLYAREHPSEHDSSWVVEGAIRFLLSGNPRAVEMRQKCTFLFLPILDPDGAVLGQYDRITSCFSARKSSIETKQYASWFDQWMQSGRRLDIVLNLHNVESAEGEHLFCMYADPGRLPVSQGLHNAVVEVFQRPEAKQTFTVGKKVAGGYTTTRLSGWLASNFGTLPMLYEVNVQEKGRHLALFENRAIGQYLLEGCVNFLESSLGKDVISFADEVRKGREARSISLPKIADPFASVERIKWNSASVLAERSKRR